MDGTCEACPELTKLSDDGMSCIDVGCGPRERRLEDGTCEVCPNFMRVSDDGM